MKINTAKELLFLNLFTSIIIPEFDYCYLFCLDLLINSQSKLKFFHRCHSICEASSGIAMPS